MDEPNSYDTGDLDAFLRDLRRETIRESRNNLWTRFRDRFGYWFSGLFIVRLWVATTSRIIQAIESSDPLSLGGANGSPSGDHKSRERLQRLIKTNQRLKLRRLIANWAIFFVILQLTCSNIFFWFYLGENHYDIHPQVMIAWLSACVIEVIGILIVIARSLFPRRDKGESSRSSTTGSPR